MAACKDTRVDLSSSESSKPRSNYFRSLDESVQKRYLEKISLINYVDPYAVSSQDWKSKVEDLPELTYPDIVNYLVFSKSAYTLKDFKAFKSLEAYNQFACGWVRDVKARPFQEHTLVCGKVLHSMSVNEKPLEPWVIISEDGSVISAHCTCMAGLGESCTHVAAILFYVEYCVRHHIAKSVTEIAAYWMPPSLKDLPFARLKDINFITAKRKMELLQKDNFCESTDPASTHPRASTQAVPCPPQTPEEFKRMLQDIQNTGYRSAILSVVEPFCSEFEQTPKQRDILYLPSFYSEENENKTLEELEELGKKIDFSISAEVAQKVEEKSRGQSRNKTWHKFRAGRITASRFKAACHTRSAVSAPSLIKAVCYPEHTKIKNKATEWGCRHENVARRAFVEKLKNQHVNFSVKDVGLVINPAYPYFGASPDALVSCECCGEGCLEVKCPYCIKGTTIEENAHRLKCLKFSENKMLMLDTQHEYFYQVQAQLFVTQKKYCDFFLWSEKGEPHYERVFPNLEFWEKHACTAKQFFYKSVIPELLGKFFSKPSPYFQKPMNVQATTENPEQEKWCICGDDKGGKWIMCDQEGCTVLWYHTLCVGVTRIPKGKWICKNCKPQTKSRRST